MKSIGPMSAAVLAVLCSCAEADATRLAQVAAKVDLAAVESRSALTNLSVDDRLRDLLHRPAFAGHARLLLPWDDRS